jgi:hypothetical protein
MSKFDEKLKSYTETFKGLGRDALDMDLFTKVTKALGPSIYLTDASLVSCSDQAEQDRVKANFLIKKHGLADGANLDAAVKAVCEEMKSAKQKPRAIFYYLLVKKLGLEKNYK